MRENELNWFLRLSWFPPFSGIKANKPIVIAFGEITEFNVIIPLNAYLQQANYYYFQDLDLIPYCHQMNTATVRLKVKLNHTAGFLVGEWTDLTYDERIIVWNAYSVETER